MRNFILLILLTLPLFSVSSQSTDKPKLVVGIVVDQMRYEFLHRFDEHYTDGGFKRLTSKGFSFRNAHFNYIPTKTGPGHASVYTGTTPRVHGVIANDWYEKVQNKMIYCVEDLDASGVGGSGKIGQRSPRNLLSSTITDELKIHYQNRSKVIGLSLKDRGSILPAGHNPDGAYWFDEASGNFMTSSFYTNVLPDWVGKFNSRKLSTQYTNGKWETLMDINTYVESARDNRDYENAFFMDLEPTFPYKLNSIRKTFGVHNTLVYSPFGNTILVDFAELAIEKEQLGKDEITDFLAISFSSTDKIGHEFGPYSKEIQDTYVRLDRDLDRLFKYLDEQVGEGEWTVFLTADHAIAELPKYLNEQKQSVNYFDNKQNQPLLKKSVDEEFSATGIIENISNRQVFLNHDLLRDQNIDQVEVKKYIVDLLLEMEGVSSAYDTREIERYHDTNLDVGMLSAGINSKASGDVAYTLLPGWLSDYNLYHKGTNHGTGYSYDTHVPMIFYGWGIKKGSTVNYHPITDIAPTISTLLNIKFPSGCTGQPATELFD
ncbi:MAG: alkaline phosphatase PafA [Reichenbachiella sp.]|uniref:alkaline phosphatase PafA n=1 Tax=Reichenbachiella sp. TaxID=2184521 RepID=UPI00329909B6